MPLIAEARSVPERPSRPLLKWPGGKRNLVQFLLPLLPNDFGSYYEPFLGGGAMFFAVQPRRAFLSDKNDDLIATYIEVRDNPGDVIKRLKVLKNTESSYYKVREWKPISRAAKAARIIYLSRLSFNGIHRVNLKGQFNVPYGYKSHLKPCDPAKIVAASDRLKAAKISCEDFETAVADADRGDLVYFDPPYTTAHTNNGFVKYNAKIFTWEDQKRLSDVAHELKRRGCFVFISNAEHDSIQTLYRGFSSIIVKRHSIIAASNKHRRPITECIFHATR